MVQELTKPLTTRRQGDLIRNRRREKRFSSSSSSGGGNGVIRQRTGIQHLTASARPCLPASRLSLTPAENYVVAGNDCSRLRPVAGRDKRGREQARGLGGRRAGQ